MPIKEYVHGQQDYQLWGNVGRLIVDRRVQEKMGNCISSEPGDVWFVNMTHKSETRGFASVRIMKNKSLYLRYFYTVDDDLLGQEVLITRALNFGSEHGCKCIYTNWHKDSVILRAMDFKSSPRERGNFCRWERILEEANEKPSV